MGLFSSIWDKITGHEAARPVQSQAPASPAPASAAPASPAPAPTAPDPAPPVVQAAVDVGAVLEAMAAMKPDHGGNYRTSIVDLLKLLDLDSSLAARKELANELNVHVGADGSAEENIALHKAVVQQLAANGGKIPDAMKH